MFIMVRRDSNTEPIECWVELSGVRVAACDHDCCCDVDGWGVLSAGN